MRYRYYGLCRIDVRWAACTYDSCRMNDSWEICTVRMIHHVVGMTGDERDLRSTRAICITGGKRERIPVLLGIVRFDFVQTTKHLLLNA